MTINYTTLLGLAEPVTGTESGTWGDDVNKGITDYLDIAIAGTQTISGTQTAVTLSVTNGSSAGNNIAQAGTGGTGSAQYAIINCTGAPVSLLTITVPASSRQYIVINATSTSQSVKVVGVGPTTGVTLVAGEKAIVVWNGSDYVKVASTAPGAAAGSNTQVQYNSSGNLAGSSSLTFDGTTLATTTLDATNVEVTNLKAKDGTAAASIADSTGVITVSTELKVDNLSLNGNTLSSTDTNGNVVVAPNGTGDVQLDADTVRIGDANSNATLTTNGTGDLILNTNSGTNSGSITIEDGVNGNIIIAPNGTGQVQISNVALDLTTLEVTNIKAKDGTASMTLADSTGVVSFSANPTLSGGTANGVAYLNASKSLTSGSALTFDGTTLTTTGNAVISSNSASDALRITQVGAGNALVVEDSANPDSTPFVVTADGRAVVGYTAAITGPGANTSALQTHSTSVFQMGFGGTYWAADASGPSAYLAKSRGSSIGTRGIVSSGDSAGRVIFSGDDGTNFLATAFIESFVDGTPGTNDMPGRLVFSTTADGASSPTERMRIDNAGNVGIGGTAPAGTNLLIAKNITGASTGQAIRIAGQLIQSDITSEARGVISLLGTAASTFTLGNLQHFFAGQGAFGAGSTVTYQYGYFAASTLTGATNNYGFFSDIASGSGRYNFYANGTADNYFAGNVGIGTSSPNGKFDVAGTSGNIQMNAAGDQIAFTRNAFNYLTVTGASATLQIQATGASGTLTFATAGSERARIASTGTISLGAAPGSESLRVTPVASAVNFFNAQGNTTGNAPVLYADGSDTNINWIATSKGTGSVQLRTNAGAQVQFVVAHTASAVNYLQATGGAAGGYTRIEAQGSDTNVPILLSSKGSGNVDLWTNNGNQLGFRVSHAASAVNYVQVQGAVTGGAPILFANGTDTNVPLALSSKGTGGVALYTGIGATLQFNVAHTASAVNYLQVTGAAAGGDLKISAQGTDTDIPIVIQTKGGGNLTLTAASTATQFGVEIGANNSVNRDTYIDWHSSTGTDYDFRLIRFSGTNNAVAYVNAGSGNHSFQTNSGTEQFRVAHTASAVNYLQVTGAATGGGVTLSAQGSDTNIGVNLNTKGTGSVFLKPNNGNQIAFVASPSGTSDVNYLQATGSATGNAPTLSAAGSDTNINLSLTAKGTGLIALNNPATVLAMLEKATVSATAATGTINFDAATQPVLYYTTNASGNWTLNIRASSTQTLDSMMATGQSLTLAFLATNGATAYYQSALTIDGSSVTPKWQGGTAPTAGNASSIDAYVLTVIKTGSATFTVLASQTKFA